MKETAVTLPGPLCLGEKGGCKDHFLHGERKWKVSRIKGGKKMKKKKKEEGDFCPSSLPLA